jgi:hypothetical protein
MLVPWLKHILRVANYNVSSNNFSEIFNKILLLHLVGCLHYLS